MILSEWPEVLPSAGTESGQGWTMGIGGGIPGMAHLCMNSLRYARMHEREPSSHTAVHGCYSRNSPSLA